MLHRRQLPIVSPCDAFVGRAGDPAFCESCAKTVHDLSGMRSREVIALLRRTRGQDVCISYRTREDGSIALRPDGRPLALLGLALALAACAGHLDETPTGTGDCVDASGAEVPCPPARFGDAVVPDDGVHFGGTLPEGEATGTSELAARTDDGLVTDDALGREIDAHEVAGEEADTSATSERTPEDAADVSSCVVTDRMRQRERRRRMFIRGKMKPLTDELICEIEAQNRQEASEHRARGKTRR